MKRTRKAATLTIRLTQDTRDRLGASAQVDQTSVSEAAERAINDGLFWRAFQRTIMAESDATPTPAEIKAALRTLELLKVRSA